MKKIQAIVKPFQLEPVKEAVIEAGATGLTAVEAKGCGRQKGHTEHYRGAEYVSELLPKILLEILVPDELAEKMVKAVAEAARTGRIGDGKVFVLPVADAVRIRTGERGEAALE